MLASCAYAPVPVASAPQQAHLVALDAAECRALLRDDAAADSLRQAAARSLDYFEKLPPDREFVALDRRVTVAALTAMLNAFSTASDDQSQLCDRFLLYRVALPEQLLVTGYYQPELPASRTRTERFRYPLYRTPDDLVDVDLGQFCPACNGRITQGRVHDGKLVPYYSRGDIDMGALGGRGYELAWLDDPVEAFFLHVQGSARLRFDDGVHLDVSYASSNGRPYTSIGRVLIEQGKMARDTVTLQSLKDYLRTHPDEQAALMAANQRYIFFRAVVAGPVGSLGVPLTAGRSIAADATVYPPGGVAFLRIAREQFAQRDLPPMTRVMVIQDAGAAITGPDRIDVFWGTGSTAENLAGSMRDRGDLYLVLPR